MPTCERFDRIRYSFAVDNGDITFIISQSYNQWNRKPFTYRLFTMKFFIFFHICLFNFFCSVRICKFMVASDDCLFCWCAKRILGIIYNIPLPPFNWSFWWSICTDHSYHINIYSQLASNETHCVTRFAIYYIYFSDHPTDAYSN